MTDIKIAYDTDYTQISNKYILTHDTESCSNKFGNYFDKCKSESAQWGNTTEVKDYDISMNSRPCMKIFNNSTKRKSVVYYDR